MLIRYEKYARITVPGLYKRPSHNEIFYDSKNATQLSVNKTQIIRHGRLHARLGFMGSLPWL